MTNDQRVRVEASSDFACDVVYQNDEARVLVRGSLGLQTVSSVRRAVLAAAALPISRVTVDLDRVESVDRYSVNVLVTLRDQVRERSTRFVLASPSPPVCRALGAAGVWELFEHESIWSEHPTSELST